MRGPLVVQSLAREKVGRCTGETCAETSRRLHDPSGRLASRHSPAYMRERLALLADIEKAGRGTRTKDNPLRSS
jgi:hypothetical protein